MAYNGIQAGAKGVDMGRNIFQSEAPVAMIKAVREVVHKGATPDEAYEMFKKLKDEEEQLISIDKK
jgi:putative autoinducer-2 (AI-2) aldolase